ncbi:MAG: HAD-IA family hydrolase [Chthonomonas sp.]|nr:HAD-IA family hydrolase [Chthonomonas sp.]
MTVLQALSECKAVLFDVDGTLADTVPIIAAGLGDTFEEFSGTRPDDGFLRSIIGRPLHDQMNLLGLGESAPHEVQDRVQFAMDRFRHHQSRSRLFEPAVLAMHQLRGAGKRIGLVTSKNRVELREFLDQFPALSQVDSVIAAEDAAHPKPAGDPAEAACHQLQVTPAEAILIGDSAFDLECAASAGVRSIGVTYGAGTVGQLAKWHPLAMFDTPEALLEAIQQSLEIPYAKTESNH